MNQRKWLLGLGLVLLGFIAGALAFGAIGRASYGYVPPLKVVGDVADCKTFRNLKEAGSVEKITFQGTRYQVVKLTDIIQAAGPTANAVQIYFLCSDGFAPAIKAEAIEASYVTFTAKNGWEALNLHHPVSSNAKMIDKILVVSDGSSGDSALSIITRDADLVRVTPGQLYTRSLTEYPYSEGKASLDNEGRTYESHVYTMRKVFKLGDLTPVKEGDRILVMGENGLYRLLDNRGYFELKDNYVNYLEAGARSTVEKVRGVIIDPPAASLMDVYYDSRHYVEGGQKVLAVILDGFNYRQYSYAVANGYAPFLSKAGPAVKAAGVYPSNINVGLAAMITGKPPEENGVITAEDKVLQVSSILADMNRRSKQAVLLEAGRSLLDTGGQSVVCDDENADGTADDELCAMTMAEIDKGYDLLMVRFHGIAASGEEYGRLSDQALASIRATDQYLQRIAAEWPGIIIVAADQGTWPGQPDSPEGDFSSDSMFVPYIRLR